MTFILLSKLDVYSFFDKMTEDINYLAIEKDCTQKSYIEVGVDLNGSKMVTIIKAAGLKKTTTHLSTKSK